MTTADITGDAAALIGCALLIASWALSLRWRR